MVGGMAITLTYGLDIKETDDPYVKRAETGVGSIITITASGMYCRFTSHLATCPELGPWSSIPETGEGLPKNSRGLSRRAVYRDN